MRNNKTEKELDGLYDLFKKLYLLGTSESNVNEEHFKDNVNKMYDNISGYIISTMSLVDMDNYDNQDEVILLLNVFHYFSVVNDNYILNKFKVIIKTIIKVLIDSYPSVLNSKLNETFTNYIADNLDNGNEKRKYPLYLYTFNINDSLLSNLGWINNDFFNIVNYTIIRENIRNISAESLSGFISSQFLGLFNYLLNSELCDITMKITLEKINSHYDIIPRDPEWSEDYHNKIRENFDYISDRCNIDIFKNRLRHIISMTEEIAECDMYKMVYKHLLYDLTCYIGFLNKSLFKNTNISYLRSIDNKINNDVVSKVITYSIESLDYIIDVIGE